MSVKEKKREGEKIKPPAPHGPRPIPTQPASPPRSHLQSPVHRSLGGRCSLVHAADPPHVVHPPPPRMDKRTPLTPWQTLIPSLLSISAALSRSSPPFLHARRSRRSAVAIDAATGHLELRLEVQQLRRARPHLLRPQIDTRNCRIVAIVLFFPSAPPRSPPRFAASRLPPASPTTPSSVL